MNENYYLIVIFVSSDERHQNYFVMACEIFISYSSHDAEQAFEICSYIENHNFECWIAPRNILPGTSYACEIVNGIKECTLVVLILSEYSLQSEHVLNEIEIAVKAGKIILPYVITGLNINDTTYLQLTSPIALIERIIANKNLFLQKSWLSIITDFDAFVFVNESTCFNVFDNILTTFALSRNDNTLVIQSRDKKYTCIYNIKGDTSTQLNIRFHDFKRESIALQEKVRHEIIQKYDVYEDFMFKEGIACVLFNEHGRIKLIDLQLKIITEIENYYPYDYYNSMYSEGTIRLQVEVGLGHELYGYLSIDGKPLIPFRFRDSRPFSEGLAAVTTDGDKWGYINKTGTYVIPPIYDLCFSFHEERAVVKVEGKYRIVDKQGKYIIDKSFKNSRKLYRDGLLCVCENDLWGYLDYRGLFVIPAEYTSAKSFSIGLAPVKKNDKWGYINVMNEISIDFLYDSASLFSEVFEIAVIRRNEKKGIIDIKGNDIVKPEFDDIVTEGYNLMSNYLLVKDNLYGLYSCDKSTFIYPKYKEFENHNVFNNLTAVASTTDNQWVIITKDLNEIYTDSKIEYIRPFYYGEISKYSIHDRWGLIDNTGHILTDAIYDSIYLSRNEPYYIIQRNGKRGAITKDGIEFLPCIFEELYLLYDCFSATLNCLHNKTIKIDFNGFLLSHSDLNDKYNEIIKTVKLIYQGYLNGEYTYEEYFKYSNMVV